MLLDQFETATAFTVCNLSGNSKQISVIIMCKLCGNHTSAPGGGFNYNRSIGHTRYNTVTFGKIMFIRFGMFTELGYESAMQQHIFCQQGML